MFSRLVIAFLIVILSACGPPGPVHKLRHTFTLPKSETGKACVNQCRADGNQCMQDAGSRQVELGNECEARARERAKLDYRDYVQSRKAKGKRIKRSESFFYDGGNCSSEGDTLRDICVDHYHKCYRACGGQVSGQVICVANCTTKKSQ